MIEEQITQVLKRLKNDSSLITELYERLRLSGSIILRLYDLPKINKSELPMPTILDMAGSLYHYVAKWIVELLEPLGSEGTAE
uniref:Uncharacterized protein n=1 Tax=Trichobilharzia regenti TaxID=157069 RepID=A0AA85JIU5_TRIRE|nr:unnamed protein product [Trichobilharzia regenti]